MESLWRQRLLLIVALLCAAALTPERSSAIPVNALPSLMLWAWERPEDLRTLPQGAGVAFLAQRFAIDRPHPERIPRLQPLRVQPGTPLVAVTRIDTPRAAAPLDDDDLADIATGIVRTASLPDVVGVQVDFDALESMRPTYARLLERIRVQLPADKLLSITALASWCVDDGWLASLPVDEIVPMLFRMGPSPEPYRRIAWSRELAHVECRHAVGVSLDEPIPLRSAGRRVYVFAPQVWTNESTNRASQLQHD